MKFDVLLFGTLLLVAFCSYTVEANKLIPSPKAFCSNAPNKPIRSCPENEEFQCCGACEQLGCNKRVSNVMCFVCPSDCYCKEGYIRERAFLGTGPNRARCVPVKHCPKTA
ncbi:chymotrypsin inhibitor Ani s 6 [Aedes albopictus]|uniref:TIL domain-containing protein n=2 Tax=Aedes albopictus TaxID=7160 RepID=A0ABM1Z1U1_AEDAL|nr:chymotrypsin inhibitor Ani s 6-like [Aedes albopictus]